MIDMKSILERRELTGTDEVLITKTERREIADEIDALRADIAPLEAKIIATENERNAALEKLRIALGGLRSVWGSFDDTDSLKYDDLIESWLAAKKKAVEALAEIEKIK